MEEMFPPGELQMNNERTTTITVITQWVSRKTMNNKIHDPRPCNAYKLTSNESLIQDMLSEVFMYWQDRKGKKAPSPSSKDILMVKYGDKADYYLAKSYNFVKITSEQFLEWKARTLYSKVLGRHPEYSEFWDGLEDI